MAEEIVSLFPQFNIISSLFFSACVGLIFLIIFWIKDRKVPKDRKILYIILSSGGIFEGFYILASALGIGLYKYGIIAKPLFSYDVTDFSALIIFAGAIIFFRGCNELIKLFRGR